MTKELILKCIAAASIAKDYELIEELTRELNPKEVKKRTRNLTGVVQVDKQTGQELNRFETIKQANIAIGKNENSSGISDAINRHNSHFAYGFLWYHIDEWENK